MNLILGKRIKYYTKEALKFLNITLISFGFIIAIILIKYKPIYEVNIDGKSLGYVQSKDAFNEIVQNNVENYDAKNIKEVSLIEKPQYQLKFVQKEQETNESEVIIALQNNLDITYEYYEISLNGNVIEKIDTIESANQIKDEISELTDDKITLTINKADTKNIEELSFNNVEIAKNNIIDILDIAEPIANINGIKIAILPVTGVITSRYGVSSSIRSSAHTGLDIATTIGTPIKVIADGTVTFATDNGSYGNLVKVQHENNVETWYAHTSRIYVSVGQQVKSGDVIAAVGSTGNSTGPHLHLEVRINGQHVNPQKYLYK